MRVLIVSVVMLFLFSNKVLALQLNGSVAKQELMKKSRVIDENTGLSVEDAQISIPSSSFSTFTGSNGEFNLPKGMELPYVLSVKKPGYVPFSLTVNETGAALTLEIEKNRMNKLTIESDTYHLGDGQFSDNSANANDFKLTPMGSSYQKVFSVQKLAPHQNLYLSVGSIIGIDTLEAKNLGQTGVKYAYSSAPKVYFNKTEIGELRLNGDNKKMIIPKSAIKQGQKNVLRIVAGVNLFQHDYTDYDDFEFTHLFLEVK